MLMHLLNLNILYLFILLQLKINLAITELPVNLRAIETVSVLFKLHALNLIRIAFRPASSLSG
jgi:hypothetical protein